MIPFLAALCRSTNIIEDRKGFVIRLDGHWKALESTYPYGSKRVKIYQDQSHGSWSLLRTVRVTLIKPKNHEV